MCGLLMIHTRSRVTHHLGTDVEGSSKYSTSGRVCVGNHLRNAKVTYLHNSLLGEKNVLSLQVTEVNERLP